MRISNEVHEAQQKVSELRSKYALAKPEEKPELLADITRSEQLLSTVREQHEEKRTGIDITEEHPLHSKHDKTPLTKPAAY